MAGMPDQAALDRRGFLKALAALGGLGVAAATVGGGTAAAVASTGLVRRTESGEPRVLLHDGAVMKNVTVENAPIDVVTNGPVTIAHSMFTTAPGSHAIGISQPHPHDEEPGTLAF